MQIYDYSLVLVTPQTGTVPVSGAVPLQECNGCGVLLITIFFYMKKNTYFCIIKL